MDDTTDITEMTPREARKHVEALFKKIASLRADGDTDALEKLLNSIPHTELLDMAAMIHEWADTHRSHADGHNQRADRLSDLARGALEPV